MTTKEWAVTRIKHDEFCVWADECGSRAEIVFGGRSFCLPCGMSALAEKMHDSLAEALMLNRIRA